MIKQTWVSLVGRQRTEYIIERLATWMNIDLLLLSYQRMGILKYETSEISGEAFVINGVLKRLIANPQPIIFDVGANIGQYSKQLRNAFPGALIYAFEPNGLTYEVLNVVLDDMDVQCYNLGLGSQIGKQKLFTYANDLTSQHATVYETVLTEIHKSEHTVQTEFEVTTIDHFCSKKGIEFIDFLKIDTEGSELTVLQGAAQMINDNRIGFIQFEFNEMNVMSRCFLRDFYDILEKYSLYRLDTARLVPLGGYDTINEIFKFQNMLAVPSSRISDLLS